MGADRWAARILDQDGGGYVMLARASTAAEALDIAHGEAAGEGLVVEWPGEVSIDWVRALPCVPRSSGGHDSGGDWCEGGRACHYVPSQPGPGAFRAAWITVTPADLLDPDDTRLYRYEAEVAAMEARGRKAAGEDGT